jgi:hypothetical protein
MRVNCRPQICSLQRLSRVRLFRGSVELDETVRVERLLWENFPLIITAILSAPNFFFSKCFNSLTVVDFNNNFLILTSF